MKHVDMHARIIGLAFAHLMVLHIHLPPDYANPSVYAQEVSGDQRGELAITEWGDNLLTGLEITKKR